jgi:thiamine-phosphate pyrophosphorylase
MSVSSSISATASWAPPNRRALVAARERRRALLKGIYVIVNEGLRTIDLARAALGAGVKIVQYRAKEGIEERHLRAIRDVAEASGALLILNDDWRAAKRWQCDGVHLGRGDDGFDDSTEIRRLWPDAIVGISCGTVEEARAIASRDADYVGVGAVFATSSKADAGEPIGIDGLARVAAATSLPVAAIGGITFENLPEVRRIGVAMAAVISAIGGAANPAAAAQRLVKAWDKS